MRHTENWDILNLIIVDHVTYLAVFSRSEISDFIQKILEYSNESVLFIHKNFPNIKKWSIFWKIRFEWLILLIH